MISPLSFRSSRCVISRATRRIVAHVLRHLCPLQRHGFTAMKNTVTKTSRLASIPVRAKRLDTSQYSALSSTSPAPAAATSRSESSIALAS